MRVILGALLVLLAAAVAGGGEPPKGEGEPTADLVIEVLGLRSDEGYVNIAVYDSAETFLSKSAMGKITAIRDRKAAVTFPDIPPGEYGVAVIHDRNANKRLDTGIFRIPKEPYGFSNNARGRFGPPKWEKVLFEVGTETVTMKIRVK